MSALTQAYRKDYERVLEERKQQINTSSMTVWLSYYSTVTNTFSWSGLNKEIPLWYPEKYLCYNGLIACDNGKIYSAFPNGTLEEFGEWTEYTLVAPNGETFIKKHDELELCYNNNLMLPSIWIINELAQKSSNALNAVDMALWRATYGALISCKDLQTKSTIEKYLSEKTTLKPAIVTLNDSIKDDVNISRFFDNKVDDILALWDVHVRYRNLFYTTFGVNNVEIQKRERLTEAEGSGNDEITRYTLLKEMYDCRKDFVNRCNSRFNVNYNVTLNRDSATVYNIVESEEDKIKDTKIDILKGANLGGVENADEV